MRTTLPIHDVITYVLNDITCTLLPAAMLVMDMAHGKGKFMLWDNQWHEVPSVLVQLLGSLSRSPTFQRG